MTKLTEKEILDKLTSDQIKAVKKLDGYVRVIAGAGSGKTRVLSRRYAYLVDCADIEPKNILCVTFTRKATAQMREKIHALLGDKDTGYISTFHGLCVNILRDHCSVLRIPKNFKIVDTSYMYEIFDAIYDEKKIDKRSISYEEAKEQIAYCKSWLHPDYADLYLTPSISDLESKYKGATLINDMIFYGYLYYCKKVWGIDFLDIIKFTYMVFEADPKVKQKWQKRFSYIMIDEFQDIDESQYNLMKILSEKHKNLFVVGDPDQMIYSWRGADEKFLLDFDKDFPMTTTIPMVLNFRSTKEILDAANSLIENNVARYPKDLIADRKVPDAPKVVCQYCTSIEDEAKWIAKEINTLHKKQKIKYEDIAILYRGHYLTDSLEKALLAEKIPHSIYGSVGFYSRLEIREALAYLRMLMGADDLSFIATINAPKRGIGTKRMDLLKDYADKHSVTLYEALKANVTDPQFNRDDIKTYIATIDDLTKVIKTEKTSELLSMLLDRMGYMDDLISRGESERHENIAELQQSIADYEIEAMSPVFLEDYLQDVGLLIDSDTEDDESKVKLMTVHAAKGLEFPVVFMYEMVENTFPSHKASSAANMEEERRLAFVAMTRAEDRLYMTMSGGTASKPDSKYPSRFVLEIDQKLLDWKTKPPKERMEKIAKEVKTAKAARTLVMSKPLFTMGERVRQKIWGDGKIIAVDMYEKEYTIQFDKFTDSKTLSFSADLEKI